jgi:hypothetical protein
MPYSAGLAGAWRAAISSTKKITVAAVFLSKRGSL